MEDGDPRPRRLVLVSGLDPALEGVSGIAVREALDDEVLVHPGLPAAPREAVHKAGAMQSLDRVRLPRLVRLVMVAVDAVDADLVLPVLRQGLDHEVVGFRLHDARLVEEVAADEEPGYPMLEAVGEDIVEHGDAVEEAIVTDRELAPKSHVEVGGDGDLRHDGKSKTAETAASTASPSASARSKRWPTNIAGKGATVSNATKRTSPPGLQ